MLRVTWKTSQYIYKETETGEYNCFGKMQNSIGKKNRKKKY